MKAGSQLKINRYIAPVVLAGLLFSTTAFAQTAKSGGVGGFTMSAESSVANKNSARLVGNARIKSPQMDLASDVIAMDYNGGQILEVRARGNVKMRVDMVPQGGGPASRVEASAKSATLKVATRTLVLEGSVNGYYQLPGGGKNTLSGSRAVLTFNADKSLLADLEGGTQGVKLVLPTENPSLPTSIGTVTVTAQKASLNSVSGVGQFTGNARAVSTDAANKFDVSAPAFVVSRGASGQLETLKTTGRTSIKIDFPAEEAATTLPAAPLAPTSVPADKPAMTDAARQLGKPTRMEVSADGATVRRSDNTLILEGNVQGFYNLTRADGTVTKQQFSGEKAVVRFVTPDKVTADLPAGLQLEISGKPVTIEVPQFDLSF